MVDHHADSSDLVVLDSDIDWRIVAEHDRRFATLTAPIEMLVLVENWVFRVKELLEFFREQRTDRVAVEGQDRDHVAAVELKVALEENVRLLLHLDKLEDLAW